MSCPFSLFGDVGKNINITQRRFLAFLLLCIPIRLTFVYLAKTLDKKYLPYLGYLALLPAIGFAYIFIFGKRKTGPETFGEKIWWNDVRPIHSIIYFLFAFLAISKSDNAYIPLAIDVIIGLSGFLLYHSNSGSFQKLLD